MHRCAEDLLPRIADKDLCAVSGSFKCFLTILEWRTRKEEKRLYKTHKETYLNSNTVSV